MALGEKGQASITDAFFILIIVSVLSLGMFASSVDYGRDVENVLSGFYNEDFVTSALQAFLSSSAPRFAEEDIKTAKEVDYLLAKLKEDYADKGGFNEKTKDLIKRNVDTIMSSRAYSYDYLLYFWTPEDYPESETRGSREERFIFIYLNMAEWDDENVWLDVNRAKYYCFPEIGFVEMNDLVFEAAPSAARARTVTTLFKRAVSLTESDDVFVFNGLIMWQSAGVLPGREEESITESLNCRAVS